MLSLRRTFATLLVVLTMGIATAQTADAGAPDGFPCGAGTFVTPNPFGATEYRLVSSVQDPGNVGGTFYYDVYDAFPGTGELGGTEDYYEYNYSFSCHRYYY